jgi:uncharacterized protein (TIGR00251 family)
MARVAVIVSPGARRSEIVGRHGEAWKVRVAVAPERGRANAALTEVLAAALGVSADDVRVVAGERARRKVVEVAGVGAAEIDRRLTAD